MTKRGIAILTVTVLVVGFAAAAIASSIGGSGDEPATHVMPNGETMPNDRAMPNMHTMPNGRTMEGQAHE